MKRLLLCGFFVVFSLLSQTFEFNVLSNGVAFAASPVSGFPCGKPVVDAWQNNQLILWRDCQNNKLHLISSGGVNGSVRAGSVESKNGFNHMAGDSVETASVDVLDLNDSELLVFRFVNEPGAADRLSFHADRMDDLCVSTDSSNTQFVLVGTHLKPVPAPFNPVTLLPCGVDVDSDDSHCGYPASEYRDNDKLLIWRDCGSRVWHVRNRSQQARFRGEILSATGFTNLVNISVESGSHDELEQIDAGRIDFALSSNGVNSDEFLFVVAEHESFCLQVEGDIVNTVVVGKTGTQLTSPVDPVKMSTGECLQQFVQAVHSEGSCESSGLIDSRVEDADVFVANWGADHNPGTYSKPVQTLGRAARLARGKDLVVVRGGIYRKQQVINDGGTLYKPLVFAAFPGEKPIFDGAGVWVSRNRGLIQVQASNLVFDGLEIRNSVGRGFSVYASNNVRLQRSYVHDIKHKGFGGSGNDLVLENNRFVNLVTGARWGNFGQPWDGGVSTWVQPSGQLSHGFVLRNNYIARVWGECVIPIFTHGAKIIGNHIEDCYSVAVYADNAKNLTIDGNMIGRRTTEFNRRDNGRAAVGVGLAVERYDINAVKLDNVTISNNLILGADRGVSFYDDPRHSSVNNSYQRVVIANNVICGNRHEAIQFPATRGAWPYGNSVKNNILCRGTAPANTTVMLDQASGWSLSHNAYPHGVPSVDNGSWISGDSGFVVGSGLKRSAWQLRSDSRLKNAGTPLNLVPHDAFCASRTNGATSIGIFD